MAAAPVLNRAFMQTCWLVPDLAAAIDGWVRTAGVGPFFWFDDVGATEGRHRGQPADFPTSTAAIAYAGDLQIELVCQENDEPGIFRDLFPRGQYGLHHVAVISDDYETDRDAYLAGGAELAYEARIGCHGVMARWSKFGHGEPFQQMSSGWTMTSHAHRGSSVRLALAPWMVRCVCTVTSPSS